MFDNMKYATVGADVFIATGYKRAKDALLSYPVANWPPFYRMPGSQSTLNVFQISELYKTYYYKNGGQFVKVPKYTYTKVPVVGTYVYSQKGSETTPILQPDDFKDVLTYVVENKGDSKSGPVQNVRNERYANFAESLDTFIRNTAELKSMLKSTTASNLSGAAGNLGSAAQGLFQGAMASPEGQKFAAGAQNAISSITSGKYSGAVSGLLQNAPGALGSIAKAAPGLTGALATKAVGTAGSLALKNPVGTITMAKKFGGVGF
jgi:hypothetical protein